MVPNLYCHGNVIRILPPRASNNVGGEEDRTSVIAWIETYGFEVRRRAGRFDRASLDSVHVVISALPLSDQNTFKSHPPFEEELTATWRPPTPSACTISEIELLRDWVGRGGALFLIFDHLTGAVANAEICAYDQSHTIIFV